jgi:predicted MFS family arabinose efflux permease
LHAGGRPRDMAAMSASDPAAGLPILLLATAGFLSSGGARVIDPLLSVIATDFGTTVPAVSVVVAAYTLPYGLCQIFLGPAGDRFGKLRVVLWAMAAFAVATGACALAQGVLGLALLRVAAGAASAAIIPVCMAIIADAVPYAERQVTLSRFLNGNVLAQLVAGPVGGIAGEFLGWRQVFLLLAAGGVGLTVALWVRLRRQRVAHGMPTFSLANYVVLARHAMARRILLFALLDGALLMGCFPFLAPFMNAAFGLSYAAVGLVLACFGAGALLYTRFARQLVPWLGEGGCVLAGGALMAGGIVAGVLVREWWCFVPIEAALGLGFYMLHGVMQARATELLPQARATAVSSFAFLLFLGQSLGALGIGVLIAHFGYRVAFGVDAAGIVLLAAALSRVMRRPAGAAG